MREDKREEWGERICRLETNFDNTEKTLREINKSIHKLSAEVRVHNEVSAKANQNMNNLRTLSEKMDQLREIVQGNCKDLTRLEGREQGQLKQREGLLWGIMIMVGLCTLLTGLVGYLTL